jgi:cation-dependent mannose-6-phosphate receptor
MNLLLTPFAGASLPNDRRTIMRFSYVCVVLALSAIGSTADEKSKEKQLKPCTIRSPSSGAFFDLRSLYIQPPSKDSKSSKKDDKLESWHARGYDYGANFTLNLCGPVVEELDDVVGVSKSLLEDVSAFYTRGRKTYSIGYATFAHLD